MTDLGSTPPPPPEDGLRRQAVGGARWTVISAATITALQFVQLAVLGRLLDPRDFGLMALVLIVLNFAQLFAQAGLSEALIQRKDPTREELSSLYWLNVALSIVAFIVVWVASPMIARILGAPALKELLPIAALSFLIVPFGFQFRALARKALRLRLLAGVDITTVAVALAVAVPSAWFLEQGVWSLVWGYLTGTSVGALLLIIFGWRAGTTRPLFHFRGEDLAGYLGFGLYRTGAMGVNFFNVRVAQLLVGAFLGAQALGYFSVASNLALQPIQKLNLSLSQVAFPVFSKVQDDVARLRRGYLEMIRLLVLVSAPVLIGAATIAPTAVPLLLGEQWTEAIPLVQVLAFYALLRSVGSVGGSLHMAQGKADLMFYWSVAQLLVIPLAVYLASLLGGDVVYVAWSLLVAQLLLTLAKYRLLTRRLIGPCFGPYMRATGAPIVLAGIMSMAVLATGAALVDLSDPVRLGAQVLVGVMSYALLSWLFQRKALLGAMSLLRVRG